MAVRPSVRFDVFKRDGFTCQYCGRKAPDVILEVDHIIPVSQGGQDTIENLATSCWDCNRGKGAGDLESRAPVPDLEERAELILEREGQLRYYNKVKEFERQNRDSRFDEVWNYWFTAWGEEKLARWHTPWPKYLEHAIAKIGTIEVKDAIDITRGKFNYVTTDAVRYFGGILKRKIADIEGRVVACTICGKRIILEPGQDTTLSWHHGDCGNNADG